MRNVLTLAAAVAALVLAARSAVAQQPTPAPGVAQQGLAPMPAEAMPAEGCGCAQCECTDACGDPCARPCGCGRFCGPTCLWRKYCEKWASYGQFNCSCRGSYKFPVPPQYTYHWPGMYAQHTMTEYSSPYRFPPLNPPPVGEEAEPEPELGVGPGLPGAGVPIRQTSRLLPVTRNTPAEVRASDAFRQHYGTD